MTGEAIAAIIAGIITAVMAGIGGLILAIVNARSVAKKSDLDSLRCIIDTQATQITNLQAENTALHNADNLVRQENLQQRQELEEVRKENRLLRAKVEALQHENEQLKEQLKGYQLKEPQVMPA